MRALTTRFLGFPDSYPLGAPMCRLIFNTDSRPGQLSTSTGVQVRGSDLPGLVE
jgi:hypothetical protein